MATLVSALITSIRYSIKDTGTTDPSWTDAEILEYINQAQDIILQRLAINKSDVGLSVSSVSLVAGTENYAVPSNFWDHKSLLIDGQKDSLSQVGYDDIKTFNANFSSKQQVPERYALYNDYFYLRPIPDAVYTLNIFYYAQPTALTTASNMPFKELYNQAIKKYAVAQCFLRDEFNEDKEEKALSGLIETADRVMMHRDKSLKRVTAYRWEYEGLI
jgi:hypothetical protein